MRAHSAPPRLAPPLRIRWCRHQRLAKRRLGPVWRPWRDDDNDDNDDDDDATRDANDNDDGDAIIDTNADDHNACVDDTFTSKWLPSQPLHLPRSSLTASSAREQQGPYLLSPRAAGRFLQDDVV